MATVTIQQNFMKTQIQNLISGEANVRRDLTHSKYANVTRSTSFGDYAGSKTSERRVIANKVLLENQGDLNLEICGKTFHLTRFQSCSGKTIWWSAEISLEDYLLLTGTSENPITDYQSSFSILFYDNMKCQLFASARKNDNSQWKQRRSSWLGEEFITIL